MSARRGRPRLLGALAATIVALVVSLGTAGGFGGRPLAVAAVGTLPFLLMAWGGDRAGGRRGRVRALVLVAGALWVTAGLGAVFLLSGRRATWTLLGLPAQLAVLLVVLGVAPLLFLGVGYALTFGDED